MTYSVIGTCSLCGGQVTLPTCWYSVIPPTPTCSSCGSIASQHGKVIEMTPTNTKPVRIIVSNNTINEREANYREMLKEQLNIHEEV